MPPQRGVCGVDDRGLRCDGDDRSGHDLVGAHRAPEGSILQLILESYVSQSGAI
jgi:hypothetical protein